MTATDSTGGTGRPVIRRRLLAVAAGLGFAAIPASLTPAPDPAPGPTPAVAAANSAPPAADRGSMLYLQSCASCHGQRGEGTQRGPSLVGVGAASVDFQLSTGRMPPAGRRYQPEHREPAFSAEDIGALVRHVTTFGGDGPAVPRVGGGDVRAGRELYTANCAACHSATGFGGALTNRRIAPALDRATPTQVAEAVRVGPGLMPAFPDTVLSEHDLNAISAYVDVLQNDRGRLDRGGVSLWRIGPVPEGIVAWVVGLALVVAVARRLGSRARR